jgi:hypothetical protein
MWKFFGKKFGRSSGASVAKTPSGSLADLRGKFYLDKVSYQNTALCIYVSI